MEASKGYPVKTLQCHRKVPISQLPVYISAPMCHVIMQTARCFYAHLITQQKHSEDADLKLAASVTDFSNNACCTVNVSSSSSFTYLSQDIEQLMFTSSNDECGRITISDEYVSTRTYCLLAGTCGCSTLRLTITINLRSLSI